MNRVTLPLVLTPLKSASILKQTRLPFILNVPHYESHSRMNPPQLLRRNSSASKIPENGVSALENMNTLQDQLLSSMITSSPGKKVNKAKSPTSSSTGTDVDKPEFPKERSVFLPTTGSHKVAFGKLWLRDNCPCSKCVHPDTRQRIVDTFSIPRDLSVVDITPADGSVKVEWSDGHLSDYPQDFLTLHSHNKKKRNDTKVPLRMRPFKTHPPEQNVWPTVSYLEVMASDGGVLRWLQKIYDWGFCFVRGTPTDPESTEALLKRIAFIRETHYGAFWDFTADLTFKDTAYTTEFLGAHTDNTYFTDPARLQLFHLLSHTDGEGGASLLVDGFQAARILRDENPEHVHTLMTSKQPYHASGNDKVCIQPAEHNPVLKRHPQLNRLYQIRWNNYDRAIKWGWWVEEQEEWYEAARHFNEIIRRPNLEIWTQLEPGTALIFDNWRMLHGRSEFTGKRRMCGGYINNDDFISRYRLLKFGRDALLKNLGNTRQSPNNPNSYL